MEYSGLLPISQSCKRQDFPLLSATVHYDLSDVQMLANLTQTYTSNAPIEAEIRYVFPLPPDASVCAFKAVIDGDRTIRGVVKEKEKAKAEYEQAIAQGKTAAVLEQENVEIFRVSLGNIRPKQTIEVHVSFVAVVSHDGALDSLRLTFPSTIAPRYGTPPVGLSGSYRANHSALDFSLAVEMASHIKSITSPSHPIAMKLGESSIDPSSEFDPTKAHVSLASPTLLEKDIVVVLSCQGLDKPRCMVESFTMEEGSQEHTDAYALTLVPRFELPALPSQEYIFLVDRSGSMGGGKMDAVRSALQILLISLPSRGTCFNIISFGSRHSSLWPESVAYSAESVKAASAHVDTMSADYGGTEIRNAIEASFKSRIAGHGGETTSTSVFVLTDGQAYDLEGVRSSIDASVKEAKSQGFLLRVFCMGIGNAVSKAMCEKIARAGQGTAAFVGETEKPDQKLMGLLRAARGGVVEDISIDWGVGVDEVPESEADSQDFEMVSPPAGPAPPGPSISLFDEAHTASSDSTDIGPQAVTVNLPPPSRVQQAPATESLPPLYPGFRTSLFAIVRCAPGTSSQMVKINGSVLGRPVELAVPVSRTTTTAPTKKLHALAARALIQSIEEGAGQFMSERKKAEVLRLGERYGLASSQTSFIAVDEQGSPVDLVDLVDPVSAEEKPLVTIMRMAESPRILQTLGSADGSDPYRFRSVGSPPSSSRGGVRDSVLAEPAFKPSVRARNFRLQPILGDDSAIAPSKSLSTTSGSQSPNAEVKISERTATLPKQSAAASMPRRSAAAPMPVAEAVPAPTGIEAFARLQSFDGSFAPSPALFQHLGDVHTPIGLDETVWCTLLCVAYLETKFAEEREVWELMVEKAVRFVEDAVGKGRVEELKEKARACIL